MGYNDGYSLFDEIIVLSLIGSVFLISIFYYMVLQYAKRHSHKPRRKLNGDVVIRFMAIMGSGGHTMELSSLIKSLKQKNYQERYYIIADTDTLSEEKVHVLEKETFNYGKYKIMKIPRSREVGQSYFTSIFSTLKAFFACLKVVYEVKPNCLFTNGPGTAIPVVFAIFLFDLLFGRDCRIIFIESFARVKTLSLTGKILYYTKVADVIIVQWNDLVKKFPRVEYIPFFFTFSDSSNTNILEKLE